MNKKGLNLRNLILTNCIILLLLACNQGSQYITGPTLGKYKNTKDFSYLYIYSNKTYKDIKSDSTFQGLWEFISPNEIGFKNWKDQTRGNLDYKFGIVKKNTIIFDLDDESNNYFLVK